MFVFAHLALGSFLAAPSQLQQDQIPDSRASLVYIHTLPFSLERAAGSRGLEDALGQSWAA